MRRVSTNLNIADFDAVRLAIASPEDIMAWSNGEVLKPETINYRTQKPERDGLFCERIFGPVKDINPHDSKYKGIRSREAAVDKNGELVTRSIVRRERLGHISLAAPVAHIWFLRGTPSAIGLILGMTVKSLERVAYFASYIVKSVDEKKRDQLVADHEAQFKASETAIKQRYEIEAKKEDSDLKILTEKRAQELTELTHGIEEFRLQAAGLVKYNLINETEYRNLPPALQAISEVGMGGSSLKELLEGISLEDLIAKLSVEAENARGQRKKKIMKRMRLIESMLRAGIKPVSLCLSVLPVIPPDLRPMVQLTGGRFATSDLNDLYRRVINRNNRLKKLMDLNAPEVIRRNEQRMLQEAVDALIDNKNTRGGRAVASSGQRRPLKSLGDMLKGKQGRFRQNLLGKRVDYSGRSVIVAGPELYMDECGLPKMMALELFKPFVIGRLIDKELAHNIRSATRMIEAAEAAVWDALDEVIEGKYVLLNRAPSLHRLSVQAFRPVLIEGKAIQLHPLVCKGFGADFDGDQMAVHLPLSQAAQDEAREIMAASKNLLKPADGTPILHVEQDIVLGCYYLTYNKPGTTNPAKPRLFGSIDEVVMALDNRKINLQTSVSVFFRGETHQTTAGRLLFNEVFPEDFPFQNEPMTKKRLGAAMALTYQLYGQEATAMLADDIKTLGFRYATASGLSIGMTDFEDLKELDGLIAEGEKHAAAISQQFEAGFINNEERYRLTVDNWTAIDSQVEAKLSKQLDVQDNTVSIAVSSGARGSILQMKDSVGMIGVRADTTGKPIELPVRSNFKKGLSPLEYFTATRGTRKSLIDIALRTADSGYLTRRLVDVAQDVFTIYEDVEDPGFPIYREDESDLGMPFSQRLVGRFAAENIKKYAKAGELVTREIADAVATDLSVTTVRIMSVLSCSSVHGVSRKSYGIDLATGKLVAGSYPIGVIAAQSIGEPGTQLSLDSKHRAGAVTTGDDATQGLTRVEEILEVRVPKGQAYLTDISGVAKVWEEGDMYIVQVSAKEQAPLKLPLAGKSAQVADEAEVNIGEILATGEEGDQLIAPMAGKVNVSDTTITITPTSKSLVRYEIPGFKQILVKDGDKVVAGQRMTNGSINLHELMRLQGVEATQRYIMNEILYIFASKGQNIADKHLEVIIRQMFSRVQIEDSGDSEFITGDVVSKLAVEEANEQLAKKGKKAKLIKYNLLLLGITKASLSTDSFLSAASFQDTTRVLIAAATSGKVDKLFGLKENVILGRKIPVGTGARNKPDEALEVETEK